MKFAKLLLVLIAGTFVASHASQRPAPDAELKRLLGERRVAVTESPTPSAPGSNASAAPSAPGSSAATTCAYVAPASAILPGRAVDLLSLQEAFAKKAALVQPRTFASPPSSDEKWQ